MRSPKQTYGVTISIAQLFILPRVVYKKLRWPNCQVDRTQAIVHKPDVFQNTAQMAWKGEMAKQGWRAKGQGIGGEPVGEAGKGQLPSCVDRPGQERLPSDEERNDAE